MDRTRFHLRSVIPADRTIVLTTSLIRFKDEDFLNPTLRLRQKIHLVTLVFKVSVFSVYITVTKFSENTSEPLD